MHAEGSLCASTPGVTEEQPLTAPAAAEVRRLQKLKAEHERRLCAIRNRVSHLRNQEQQVWKDVSRIQMYSYQQQEIASRRQAKQAEIMRIHREQAYRQELLREHVQAQRNQAKQREPATRVRAELNQHAARRAREVARKAQAALAEAKERVRLRKAEAVETRREEIRQRKFRAELDAAYRSQARQDDAFVRLLQAQEEMRALEMEISLAEDEEIAAVSRLQSTQSARSDMWAQMQASTADAPEGGAGEDEEEGSDYGGDSTVFTASDFRSFCPDPLASPRIDADDATVFFGSVATLPPLAGDANDAIVAGARYSGGTATEAFLESPTAASTPPASPGGRGHRRSASIGSQASSIAQPVTPGGHVLHEIAEEEEHLCSSAKSGISGTTTAVGSMSTSTAVTELPLGKHEHAAPPEEGEASVGAGSRASAGFEAFDDSFSEPLSATSSIAATTWASTGQMDPRRALRHAELCAALADMRSAASMPERGFRVAAEDDRQLRAGGEESRS
eukprot:CAMPEP_0176087866 /NCGR_PEP_ID=MMETSP0120_2-20121206/43992_1 /TAXON_ID=160619 /ORGANISM="Kryptoperidinium foliaceum, Strain CCMP 1326" /LENGTH=506 /DNA_ID=CAMNT_0017421717 /DNA_START=24 /DNA_END=1544 /DNA_ORIENTATION=-